MQCTRFHQRYEILDKIGSGAYSIVYKVKEKMTNAVLACKEIDYSHLPPDQGTALSNSVEGTVLMVKSLKHRHIITYQEILHDKPNKVCRIIMPYYALQDLQSYTETLREEGKVILEQNLWMIMGQLASALAYLHSDDGTSKNGIGSILHLNLNPSNILLTNDYNVVLTGFTSAVAESELGPRNAPSGKLSFCAPECLQNNQAGPGVDIWALACTMYELSTSSTLFLGITPSAVLKAINTHQMDSLEIPNYSPELLHVIKSMLIYDPRQRITAEQLVSYQKISFFLTHDVQPQEFAGQSPDTMLTFGTQQSTYYQPQSIVTSAPVLAPVSAYGEPKFIFQTSQFGASREPSVVQPPLDSLLAGDQAALAATAAAAEQSYLNYMPAKASSRIRSTSVGAKRWESDISVSGPAVPAPVPGESIIAMMTAGKRASSRGLSHMPESLLVDSEMIDSTILQDDTIRAGSGITRRSKTPVSKRRDTVTDKSMDAHLVGNQAGLSRLQMFQQSEIPSPEIIKTKPETQRLSNCSDNTDILYPNQPVRQLLQTRYNPEGELMSAFADDPTELIASHISPQPVRIRLARTGGTDVIETKNSAGEVVPRYQVKGTGSTRKGSEAEDHIISNITVNSSAPQSHYTAGHSPTASPQLMSLAKPRADIENEHKMMRRYPIEYVQSVNNQNAQLGNTSIHYGAVEPMSGHVPPPLPQGEEIYGPYATGPAQYYTVPLNTGLQGKGQLYTPNDLQAFKQSDLNFTAPGLTAGAVNEISQTYHLIDDKNKNVEPPPYTELMKAVIKNDLKAVKTCIPSDAGRTLPGGITALMIAANMGHVECVKMLIPKEGGMRQKDGTTALMEAVQKKHGEVIKQLLKKEAGMRRTDGWTSLMYCAQHDLVTIAKLLVGKEIGLQTVSGVTALMVACEHGHAEVASLLTKEAGKNAINGWTALMSACEHDYTDIALKLVSREAGMVKVDGWTALMSAARTGNLKIAKALMKKEAKCTKNDGSSALMWAASHGHVEIVKLLMNEERHIRTVTGKTAFDFAEDASNQDVMKLLRPDLFDKSGAYIGSSTGKTSANATTTQGSSTTFKGGKNGRADAGKGSAKKGKK